MNEITVIIQHLYNKYFNAEYKDFIKENGKAFKYDGNLYHITPFDLGQLASLKPQVSNGFNYDIGTENICKMRRQKILYCGMNINVCLLLAPIDVFDNEKIYIYKSISKEISYTYKEMYEDEYYEVYSFNNVLMSQIGYLDNSNNEVKKLKYYREAKIEIYKEECNEITLDYLIKVSEYIKLKEGHSYEEISE